MNEQEIMKLLPEERLKIYVEQLQESRKRHQVEKEEAKSQRIKKIKQEKFAKKQKENKFSLDTKLRQTFKLGERFTAEAFDSKTVTFLPPSDLTATEIHRTTHLIPRSYQYPEVPFKLTKNNCDEFGKTKSELLTNSGKRLIETNISKFDQEVKRRRQEEMKPKVVEFGPLWEPNKTHGGEFVKCPTDEYHLYEQKVKQKYLQTKPMLRTSRHGDVFSYP